MLVETPTQLRSQAAHARHLADGMLNREAQSELRGIAQALETQADELEGGQAPGPIPI